MPRFQFNANISIDVDADDKQRATKLAWNLLQRRIDGQQWGFSRSEGAEVKDWELTENLEVTVDRVMKDIRQRQVIDDRDRVTRIERNPLLNRDKALNEVTKF